MTQCLTIGLTCFFLALLLTPQASAQDHLKPEDSIFSKFTPRDGYYGSHQYYSDVLTVLSESYDRNVTARAIVLPSFQYEFAVALKKEGGRYSVIHLEPEYHVWNFELLRLYEADEVRSYDHDGVEKTDANIEDLKSGMPASLDDVKVKRCELALPNDLGDAITDLWISILRQTRYIEKDTSGFDGVTYHFSAPAEFQTLSGKVWSPDKNTNMGKLIEIVAELKAACLNKDASQFTKISGLTTELAARVNAQE